MAEPLQLAIPGVGRALAGTAKRQLHVSCHRCGNRFECSPQMRGQQVSCPMCEAVLSIEPRKPKER